MDIDEAKEDQSQQEELDKNKGAEGDQQIDVRFLHFLTHF